MAEVNCSTPSRRNAVWDVIDSFCAPAAEPPREDPPQPAAVEAPRYPRVMIWNAGGLAISGDLVVLTTYFSKMKRILARPFRKGKWSATFFWVDGAWSSVCFEDEDEFRAWTKGIQWPAPEAL